MTFAWPWALLSILAIALIFAVREWARRRRRKAAVRVTSIALVRTALPGRTRWVRRLPAALLIAGLALLAIGAARPQATVPVARTSATILLAIDTSGSMCSTDVDPNRITVARRSAAEFIESQRGGPRIGLVAFAGAAGVLVPPTDDTDELLRALDEMLIGSFGTAIGQAMLTSIDAIAEVDPSVAPSGVTPTEAPDGYSGSAIVVLTDGRNTQGVEPRVAAREAALRGVRVFTIGFGTTNPGPRVCDSSQTEQYGGFGGRGGGGGWGGRGGRGGFFDLDEPTLKGIAEITGGSYHRAENAGELEDALATLPGSFNVIHQRVDIAAAFAGGGALLVATALGLSLWWNRPRIPSG